jgi:hypothetical protein
MYLLDVYYSYTYWVLSDEDYIQSDITPHLGSHSAHPKNSTSIIDIYYSWDF